MDLSLTKNTVDNNQLILRQNYTLLRCVNNSCVTFLQDEPSTRFRRIKIVVISCRSRGAS